jgi:hypothetical protein
MAKLDVPIYGTTSTEDKSKTKVLKEYASLFDGKRGEPHRKIRVYFCKCGIRFREPTTFRFHAARKHELHLPCDTDHVPCLEKMEWIPVTVRRKVF